MQALESDALAAIQLQGCGVALRDRAADEYEQELSLRSAFLHYVCNLCQCTFD
jgi:hypothetical protein